MVRTDMYEGLLAETVTMTGANGDQINAYFRVRSDPAPSLPWCLPIICLAGINGIVKQV